tara:strand:- start:5347 stop:5613 length:267 start_codon:yes stop_codon:yes gene_type:complete
MWRYKYRRNYLTKDLRAQSLTSISLLVGLLCLTDQKSETIVFKLGDRFELNEHNSINEKEISNSTLAFSEGQMFLRTPKALFAISKQN